MTRDDKRGHSCCNCCICCTNCNGSRVRVSQVLAPFRPSWIFAQYDALAFSSYTLYKHAMNMTVNLKMWGNSLGIRLPSAIARSMHLEDGMVADLTVEDGQIHIVPHSKQAKPPRQRRPLSFYEARAKKRGLVTLVDAVELTPEDAPRGLEMM